MGGRQQALRRSKKPRIEWTSSDASPSSEDTIGKPYGERRKDGRHRVVHTSMDKNGEYFVGDIVRKKGTMCTQKRDCGGSNALSDSELTLDSTTNPKVPSLVTLPAIPPFPKLFPTSSLKTTESSFLTGALATNPIGAHATNPPAELEASTTEKKAQLPSQGEEKASAVEPIAEEEGTPKLASLVEREGKTT